MDSIDRHRDRRLAKSISWGKAGGIESLITEYGSFIKSIVYHRIGGRREYCEECINDIYLAIWNNIDSYDWKKSSLKNWIAGVCRYKTIDYMRKIYRESVNVNLESIKNEGTVDPEIERIEKDIHTEVEKLLEPLSPQEKKLIIDLYINDISVSSLSEILSMDKKSIYNKVYYIKNKLKKRRTQNE